MHMMLVVRDAGQSSIYRPQKPCPLENRPAQVETVPSVYKNFLCKNLQKENKYGTTACYAYD